MVALGRRRLEDRAVSMVYDTSSNGNQGHAVCVSVCDYAQRVIGNPTKDNSPKAGRSVHLEMASMIDELLSSLSLTVLFLSLKHETVPLVTCAPFFLYLNRQFGDITTNCHQVGQAQNGGLRQIGSQVIR